VYTPQQNGLAERMNFTLCNVIRCILIESGMPTSFWAEALQTACYVRNRCPTKVLDFQAPIEKWRGHKLEARDVEHLQTFGCQVWAWIPKHIEVGHWNHE
jgi:hypothetical protein